MFSRLIITIILSAMFSTSFAQNVLYVGNSLSSSNNLPSIVEQIASHYDMAINSTTIFKSYSSLEDHWEDGTIQEMISENDYDYVILQQGPSSQPNGRAMLLEYGEKIKFLCDQKLTQLAFFMVWPAAYDYEDFEGVISNYSNAAKQNNCLLIPVGENWKKYRTYKKPDLYGRDEFHPSPIGSFLAALTIFHTICPEIDLRTNPYSKSKKWLHEKSTHDLMISLVNNN